MDTIHTLIHLCLAMVPAHPALNMTRLIPVTVLLPQFAKALRFLGADFASRHCYITAVMLATGAIHMAYVVWAHNGEPPPAMGILILTGYILALIGLARAFIQEQGTAQEQNP